MIRLAVFFVAVTLSVAYPSGNLGRIVGGRNTTIENHPYQVSIQYLKKQICGGAILNPFYVITAAQCLPPENTNPNFVFLRVGTTDRTKGGIVHPAAEWKRCHWFKPETLDCDIGFYKTQTPILYTSKVRPIELITKAEYPKHGDMLTITGWGQTQLSGDAKSVVLQEARIPKLSQELCRLVYWDRATTGFTYTNNMFCAGGGVGKLINVGDFGGPIVNKNKQLVGIASGTAARWGLGNPSIFTDVTSEPVQKYISQVLNGTFIP